MRQGSNLMTIEVFAWISSGAAAAVFALGVIDVILSWRPRRDATRALANAASEAKSISESEGGLQQHSNTQSLKSSWEALASLATALKDLDRSTRLFVISLALFAITGTTLGVETVTDVLGGQQ